MQINVGLFALALAGCGILSTSPGDFGATVGGVKDIGQARKTIAEGGVPAPSTIMTEGLLAEHDFATEGAACSEVVCARPAIARHLLRSSGKQEVFVHVGLTSKLGATWQRPPVDLMVVVDKSGSMSIDMKQTLEGIALMVDHLQPTDQFGMVLFDDEARVHIPLGPVSDKAALRRKIEGVGVGGGTRGVKEGTRLGYEALAAARSPSRMSRLMLFACGLPPMGDQGFDQLVTDNAAKSIGLTFVGVLAGGDVGSARYFAAKHGGNAFFLFDLEKVRTVFDTDLDLVITPIAYDLALAATTAGATVKRVWGLPSDSQKLEATTVFASRNRGAIVLQLEAPDDAELSSLLTLTASHRPDLQSELVQGAAPVALETRGGVRKTAAIVNLSDGLTSALTLHAAGQRAAARKAVEELRAFVDTEATALDDAGLRNEVALLDQLMTNMK